MANRDLEAQKDALKAYEASNASLKDFDPTDDKPVTDPHFDATREGENTHPDEPVTMNADNVATGKATAAQRTEKAAEDKDNNKLAARKTASLHTD